MSEPRRPAAVIIAIARIAPHGVVFIERAAHLRDHPGQIGLPGGRVDAGDRDLEETALRELHEEVGIRPDRVRILGTLPLIRQRINTFDVTPFVAVVDGDVDAFQIDAGETVAAFTIPLATILGEGLRMGTVEYRGLRIQSLLLDHDGRRIWGLTARILQSFVAAWTQGPLRERIEQVLQSA